MEMIKVRNQIVYRVKKKLILESDQWDKRFRPAIQYINFYFIEHLQVTSLVIFFGI